MMDKQRERGVREEIDKVEKRDDGRAEGERGQRGERERRERERKKSYYYVLQYIDHTHFMNFFSLL